MDSSCANSLSSDSEHHFSTKKEKKGRFTIENLNRVHCVLVSDQPGLLRKASSSTTVDDDGVPSVSLLLNLKEPKAKKANENYTVHVTETSIKHGRWATHTAEDGSGPHAILCFVCTDETSDALERLQTVRQNLLSGAWSCPVVLVAYHQELEPCQEILNLLKQIAGLPLVFRCIEATAIGRNLVRHCLATALLAARPVVAAMRDVSDLRIDDEVEKKRDKIIPTHYEELVKSDHKKAHFKGCRVQ